jgi:peptidyl-prolyl cis-trans isomerase SurA
MKNIVILLISSLFVSFIGFNQLEDRNPSGMSVVDRVVAQVGDNIILYSDLEIQKLQLMSQEVPMTGDIDCRLLEELLYQNLLLNQAKVDSLIIPDAQVGGEAERRLQMIEEQIQGRENLERYYGKPYSAIKDEFIEIMRDRMLAEKMESTITSDVNLTPRDVSRFFDEVSKDTLPMVGDQVALQQIVIYPKISQRAKTTAIEELKKIRNDVIRGSRDFSMVARSVSDDKESAKNGGLIQASKGMMVRPFENAALALNIGEISEVVETQFGFHIIQLVDRQGDSYTIKHILKIPEVDGPAISQAARVIEECVKRLQDEEITWNEAVREYSEHEATRQNEGNLINPYTGESFWEIDALKQIDPNLFQIILRMQPGDISEALPFEDMQSAKIGLRVLRVRESREAHRANLKDDYSLIKQAALNMKREEAIHDWVTNHAKNTFVRVDDKYKSCNFMYEWGEMNKTF